jgi:hypothetical protein
LLYLITDVRSKRKQNKFKLKVTNTDRDKKKKKKKRKQPPGSHQLNSKNNCRFVFNMQCVKPLLKKILIGK